MLSKAFRPHRIYYGWWIVFTAVVSGSSYAFGSLCLPVFYPELVNTFEWSRTTVAAGGSIKLFVGGVMAPINGALIDRFGAKAVLSVGALGTGLSLALLSFVNSVWHYYFFCFLLGLALSGIYHLPNHLLVAKWFIRKRGLAVSMVTTAVGVGGAIIPLMATYLIRTFGWRNAFLALGVFMVIPFFMILGVVRERPGELDVEPGGPANTTTKASHVATDPADTAITMSIWDVLKSPAFWILSLCMVLIAASMFGVRDHLVLHMTDMEFSPAAAAQALSLIFTASILGRFFSGALSDKFSAVRVTVLMFFMEGLCILMLLFVSGSALIYVFPILFGLSYGAITNLKALVIFEYFGTKKVGRIYGLLLASYIVGTSFGPLATGFVFDKTGSYDASFVMNLLLACIAFLAILVFARLARPSRDLNYSGA